ncbi:MAG: hypothetical protein HN759_12790 [Akkermansiaceae bacterium]|nr:hypothetical protein [Akkermansiaceae bacterium]
MKRKCAPIKILAAIAGLAITTASAQDELKSQHGILLLTANGGINPATGFEWEYGDEYRLVFATSMGINATSSNIADYNAFVQNAANASTFRGGALGNITWKALVSTPTVAANVNTGTFGVGGESFWLVNGITVVADNYGDLYLGSGNHSSAINMSETGGSPLNNGAYSSLWTGSDGSGNPVLGNELGAAGGTSRGGLWGFTAGGHWISRFNLSQTTGGNSGDGKFAIYAISEVLTITDGVSDPTLLPSSIVDNRDGDPVGINTVVNYTVTFNKDMNDTTVTAADFGNAGTSGFSIGTVAEIGPGVFSVPVTPTSAGTLRLKVNASAVLDDEEGNSLDTASAILDDTTLIVDNTAPMLASTDFVDDQGGSSVEANTLVTYTVTFNEAMDESTVTAADFENAGTAPVTIEIGVIEIAPDDPIPAPGLFSVEVTPTGGGTLQLSIKQDAVLKDVAGNSLNTTSAILDDTTITVNGSVSNPYETWSGGETFANDTNDDGVSNGMAWAFGAATINTAATDLLPTFDYTTDPNYVICTFRRADEANDHSDTTMVVQYGTTLASASWITAVHDNDNVIITETDNHYSTTPGIDRVVVKLKRSTLGAGGKLFARLRVEQAP